MHASIGNSTGIKFPSSASLSRFHAALEGQSASDGRRRRKVLLAKRKGFVKPGDPAKLGEATVRRMRPYWERQPEGNSTSHAPPPRCRGDPPGVASQMPKRRTLPWPTRSSRPQNDYIDRSAVHSGSNRAPPQVTMTVPEAWAVCEPKGGHLQTQPLHEEPSHPRIFARRFAAPREALLW